MIKLSNNYTIKAVLNSYAILFFSQNKVLAVLLVLVSLLNVQAGLAGLAMALLAILIVTAMGFQKETIESGFYSFNALLLGIGIGTFYHFNIAFCLWLCAGCVFCVFLTVGLAAWLAKYGLPILSVPFVIAFWILLLALNGSSSMGMQQRESFLLNEIFNVGSVHTISLAGYVQNIHLSGYPDLFFRSLSAILFQNNVLAGIIMSIGLLIHSRISFCLLVMGFVTACLFNALTGTYPEGISYYHMGANFMMASCAIGGFFLIPSARSYLWTVVCMPVVFLLVGAFSKLLGVYNLPILSLPFCIITLISLYFFLLRIKPGKLKLTPVQYYSPEANLYQYLNGQERQQDLTYLRLSLPFMGSWQVTQGYNGQLTHKGGWSSALDFAITDEERHTYQLPGTRPEHFYCFNKPVLACADGVVEEAVNHVQDNAIGEVNTIQNWGNSVVIKHADGLYTKVSHLKKDSLRVKVGDYVKQGDLLGLCGNSGRSPEPHLHFQAQTLPAIGSQTLAYPFANYINHNGKDTLHQFDIPKEGMVVAALPLEMQIKQAFNFQPGYTARVVAAQGRSETWTVATDAYNYTYFRSEETGATAYFVNNGSVFYFTAFYGSRRSLLYYFYLAGYKVIFSAGKAVVAKDGFPLQLNPTALVWLQDLIAPFYQFIRHDYESRAAYRQAGFVINSAKFSDVFGRRKQEMNATIHIADGRIQEFDISMNHKQLKVQWYTEGSF